MNGFILVAIKLLIGFLALIMIINISGKGNLAPSSAGDQVQNYVLGGIIGGVIYNNSIRLLDYIGILCIWCVLVLTLKWIKKHNVKKLGFDDLSLSFAEYMMYKNAFPNVEFIPAGIEMQNARKIKTEKEISYLREAARITDIAFSETIKIIKEGITEKEIAAHLEYIQRLNGAEDKSFETIVASGHRSSMPHGVASDKKIQRNKFITQDFGCYYNGYASDMTRTVFFGDNITAEQKRIFDLVYEGQSLGISMIKPGVLGKDVDQAVRDYFKENGDMDKYFGHSLGHSFGLEVHEAPYCSKLGTEPLQENQLMTVEPGIYIENFCGVRIEDDLLVTKDGYELLTKSKRELIIID